jgi:hypothetical protein
MEVSGQLHAPAALPPGKEPLGVLKFVRRYIIKMHNKFSDTFFICLQLRSRTVRDFDVLSAKQKAGEISTSRTYTQEQHSTPMQFK